MDAYNMKRTQTALTDEDRLLLEAESRRTGRSMSALIRDAVRQAYGHRVDVDADLAAIDQAAGAWADRDVGGQEYVDQLRSGRRVHEAAGR